MGTSFVKRGVVLTINLFNALSQDFLREVRYLTRYRRQAAWKPSRHCHCNLVVLHCEQTAFYNPILHYSIKYHLFTSILFPANSTKLNRNEYLLSHCPRLASWKRNSVRPSVRPSVRLSRLFLTLIQRARHLIMTRESILVLWSW